MSDNEQRPTTAAAAAAGPLRQATAQRPGRDARTGARAEKGERRLFLVWATLLGVIVFAVFVAVREDALPVLYLSDASRLSWVITLLFVLITLYCARRTWFISCETDVANRVYALVQESERCEISIRGGDVYIDATTRLPDCLLTRHLLDLCCQARLATGETQAEGRPERPAGTSSQELFEVFEAKLKNPHDLGWFFADIMIKLGLLGTIVGFVLMLGSVVNVTDFDVNTMQSILKQMSSGMGVALYTTFAGLVCSMLTAAQFHLLDQAASSMVDTARHLAQVHLLPRL